ncbi:hypothetical protein ALC53_00266 [Atta colombica]|uniref:Uncharacterized protein n=1 Tax=Atta colombica TaxID=520822 RepID=A0A195BXF3_9HYME|nr:hypothetical protein ALC53_00266 [Atta colombica]
MDTTNYFHGLSSGFSTVQPSFNFVFRVVVLYEYVINMKTSRFRVEFQVLVMHKLRIKLQCLYIQIPNTDGFPRESEAIGPSTREVHTAHFYVTRLITLKLT